MTILFAGALGGTALLAYVAGLFSFKIKSRWCPQCGTTTHVYLYQTRDDHIGGGLSDRDSRRDVWAAQ